MTVSQQRMQALQRAEQAKAAKGDLTRQIRVLTPRDGALKVAEIVHTMHADPVMGRVRLRYLLIAIKRIGDMQVQRQIRAAGIHSQTKRLMELTPRQRDALQVELTVWAERQAA